METVLIFLLASLFVVYSRADQISGAKTVQASETGLLDELEVEQSHIETFANASEFVINFRNMSIQLANRSYDLSNNVPVLNTEDKKLFWEEKVIPILKDSVKEFLVSRQFFSNTMSGVKNFLYKVFRITDMYYKTRGSNSSIRTARKLIPREIERIGKLYNESLNFESIGIYRLSNHSDTLLSLLGPKATNYFENVEEIYLNLSKFYERKEELKFETAHLFGEFERLSYLLESASKSLDLIITDMDEIRKRTEFVRNLNRQTEIKLNNLPKKEETSNFFGVSLFGWFDVGFHWSTDEQNESAKDQEYYDNLINRRSARVKQFENDSEQKQRELKKLESEIANLTAQHQAVSIKLETKLALNADKSIELDKSIKEMKSSLDEYHIMLRNVTDITGLQGTTLFAFLFEIKQFGKQELAQSSPLAVLLKDLLDIFEWYTEPLFDDEGISFAISNMKHHAMALHKFAASTQTRLMQLESDAYTQMIG